MRIKRFEAPDNQTALRMIKQEMGEDALILATRTLAPAERRNGGNAKVEVVAAIDFDIDKITSPSSASGNIPAEGPADTIYDYSIVRQDGFDKSRNLHETRSKEGPALTNRLNKVMPRTLAAGAEKDNLPPRFPEKPATPQSKNGIAATTAGLQPGDVSHALPARNKERPDPEKVARWRRQLIDQIAVQPPAVMPKHTRPVVLALVGATGVGKTTTAAKLAAWHSLREGLKVTLISMDCYRIGATDQLRTYAKIMRLPCEVALHRNELAKTIERHLDQDLIIIDTAGKSPYNKEHVAELADWFGNGYDVLPYVVLSATSKKEDLEYILRAYRPLMPAGIMVTKLDETRAYATLCQSLAAASLPVASLSIGQKVPEDFLPASKEFLATLFQDGWHAAAEMGAA